MMEELRERVDKQTREVGMSLRRELSQDADYVKIRARYYHERRRLCLWPVRRSVEAVKWNPKKLLCKALKTCATI
jgi:hypothetical protein